MEITIVTKGAWTNDEDHNHEDEDWNYLERDGNQEDENHD
jgi:hypothetical protein